jgi:hypothetical protein
MTVGCARCHDHKFDPVARREYHAMMAVFAGSEPRDIPATHKMSLYGFYAGYPKVIRVEQIRSTIDQIDRAVRERVTNDIKAKFPPQVMNAYDKAVERRTEDERALAAQVENALTAAGLKDNASGNQFQPPYTPEEKDRRERLIYELGQAALKARFSYPAATVLGHSDKLYPVRLTNRGDWRQQEELVAPAVPKAFGIALQLQEPAEGPFVLQRRKAFAEWLTRPENPLTARVMVNRIWLGHFGKGLVPTPNDFGRQGEAPTHPELLDWLTVELMERGWRIKAMHRLILTSQAYRRSSAADAENAELDPTNRWYWRFDRQRLQAEAVRDAVLAVSGDLNLKSGGPPVFPSLTSDERLGMWEASQWPETPDEREHSRRSIYLYAKRSFPYPMFTTFDTPDSSASCGRRDVTTVAPQALALLNSEFMVKSAQRMAARLQREAPGQRDEQIRRAWLLVFSRTPSVEESGRASELLKQTGDLSHICLTLLNTNEFLYVD